MSALKRVAVGTLLVAGAAVALAAGALARSRPIEGLARPAALEASELTVHDRDGNVRGRWSVQGLSIVDKSGRVRMAMSVGDEGAPNFTLFSRNGGVRVVISLGSEDRPAITLHDERSRVRTRVIVGADDTPSVLVSDQNGDVIGRLPAPVATPGLKARKGR